MKKPFLNTAFGSYLKVFLSAVLTQYLIILNNPDLILLSYESLESLGIAGSIATVPIIINALNKNDVRYGKNKEPESPYR